MPKLPKYQEPRMIYATWKELEVLRNKIQNTLHLAFIVEIITTYRLKLNRAHQQTLYIML